MLMPMLWSNNDLFDEMDNFFNDGFFGGSCKTPRAAQQFDSMSGLMRTDVIEKDNAYQLEAELPGFNKEDISIDLKNDTLTISASHTENDDEKDNDGKYIRRERRSSSYQRSFHVEGLKPEDIIAQMKAGVPGECYKKVLCITDRREAIRTAVALAKKGDIILVAGKGHETYQDVKGVKHHFDDREELEKAFNEK